MKPSQRRERILALVREAEVMTIDELVEVMGVSSSTVRRDINRLMEVGDLIALRGGSVRLNEQVSEPSTSAKALLNPAAKTVIAEVAANLVDDGDVIYLDSGSSALQMMPLLQHKRIQLVTSNMQVLALADDFAGSIIVLGGEYLPNLGSVVGPMTARELSQMSFDKAFIGASGCSRRGGINTFDMREASKKRIVHERTRRPYVLADSSKFGVDTFYTAIDLAECQVITEAYDELLESAQGYLIAAPPRHEDLSAPPSE